LTQILFDHGSSRMVYISGIFKLSQILQVTKVVNDGAERGVALATESNSKPL
jgi:hypothetical protein